MDRHIGLSVLLTALFGVAVLSLVLVLGNVFRELLDRMINQNLPLRSVLLFMVLILPFSLVFTIPWGFLTAVLLVFGRMSAENELIALHASGVSILRVCAPVFLLALGLSGVCLWLNCEASPRAQEGVLSMLHNLAAKDPSDLFAPGDIIEAFPNRRIYIGGKEDGVLKNLIIFEVNEDNAPTRMIQAREGSISRDRDKAGLRLQLRDARFEERSKTDPLDVTAIKPGIKIADGTYFLSLDKILRSVQGKKPLRAYTLSELGKFIADGAGGQVLKARVEYQRRISLSLACVAFALVAVPLGITAHRKETTVGYGISLVLAFTYFFYIMLAQALENNPQAFPVFLVWLPNILFALVGVGLFIRLARRF